MLIAAGGGGAGGTPWGSMTMQKMQEFIQNPDTEKHYELLTGWKRSADLLIEHRWQVQNYRDNLAAAWPPARNAASLAYITRLDELIANLNETYEAAISNHDAFAAATLSISLAQKDMDEIAREYDSNDQLLATHNAKQQTPSRQPSPSLSGEQPPVAPGRQQELHQRAVTLLNDVSADLALAQVRIRKPRLYQPNKDRQDSPTGESDTVYTAPPIPPITAAFASEDGFTGSARPSATFPAPSASQPVVTQPASTQPGLILGSSNASALTPSSIGVAPPSPQGPNGGGGLVTSPGLFPTTTPGRSASDTHFVPPNATGPGRSGTPPGGSFIRPVAPTSGGMQALPPGGLIGGVPGAALNRPNTSRPALRRINPVGGVIGGSEAHRGASSRNTTGDPGVFGQAADRRTGQDSKSDPVRWDPDNPWETAEGVDPVVLPPRHQRVNPGPAIGLS